VDAKTLLKRMKADPRLSVEEGGKHTKVGMKSSGQQLCVITRSMGDQGRDVANTLALLKRNGIDLEGGDMGADGRRGRKVISEERKALLLMTFDALKKRTHKSDRALSEALCDYSVAEGEGEEVGSGSLRNLLPRLRDDHRSITPGSADLLEHLMDVMWKDLDAKAAAAPIQYTHWHDPDDVNDEDVGEDVNVLQRRVIEMIESFRAFHGYVATDRFPLGKGSFSKAAEWGAIQAEIAGRVGVGASLLREQQIKTIRSRLSLFVAKPITRRFASTAEVDAHVLWMLDRWDAVKDELGEDNPEAYSPLVTLGGDQTEETASADAEWENTTVVPLLTTSTTTGAPTVTFSTSNLTVTGAKAIPPLHMRVLARMCEAGGDTQEALDLAEEVRQLELLSQGIFNTQSTRTA